MGRFKVLFAVGKNLRNMNREAAIDSLRNVLAVLGLGLLIGDFATMNPMYVLPGALLLIAVWYADYLRHDLPSMPTMGSASTADQAVKSALDPVNELGRAA